MIWYLDRSRPEIGSRFSLDRYDRDRFLQLQTEMFGFVTPTMRGVHNSDIFTKGIVNYGEAHGVKIATSVLDVPQFMRPSVKSVYDFVAEGLQSDCPVAFLNLSNGNQHQLDNWHWVTIIAIDDAMSAKICDQGRIIHVNLGAWLRTTMLGGAFVFVRFSGGTQREL
jgi:hypothetical protein